MQGAQAGTMSGPQLRGTMLRCEQINTPYKPRFFVLTDEMFEYYEDETSYLAEKEGGLRGSIPARNIKVSNGTPRGHDKTRDGYHCTTENTSNGRVVECACQDAQGRDMWLEKIQACITTRDTPLISFDTFHSCISQAAWSDRMLDQIPLAEIEQISYQIVNCRRSRNSLESLKKQRKLSESPDEGKGDRSIFLQRMIKLLEHVCCPGFDIDGDGRTKLNTIPTLDCSSEEVHLIIRTCEGGYSSGRTYLFRPQQSCAQLWLDLISKHSKLEHEREINLKMREEHGDSRVSLFRAKTKRFYEAELFQWFSALVVIGGFAMDVAQAQLTPADGSDLKKKFFDCDVLITFLFALELALNIFANSSNCFHGFYSHAANWFDFCLVFVQVFSLIIESVVSANIPAAAALRLFRMLRILRVLRLFRRVQGLSRLCQAVWYAMGPVCYAFLMLAICSAMFSISELTT
jgi:hypothetical protein